MLKRKHWLRLISMKINHLLMILASIALVSCAGVNAHAGTLRITDLSESHARLAYLSEIPGAQTSHSGSAADFEDGDAHLDQDDKERQSGAGVQKAVDNTEKKKELLGEITVWDSRYRELQSDSYSEQREGTRQQSIQLTFRQLQEKYQEYEDTRSPSEKYAKAYVKLAGTSREQFDPYWRHLDDNVAILHYFISQSGPTVFVISRQAIQPVKLTATEKQIENSIDDFMENNKDSESESSKPPTSQLKRLYDYLLAPLEGTLASTRVVGIIPDSKLQHLPFAALTWDGKTYFGDNHELFYLPSARELSVIEVKHRQPKNLLAVDPGVVKGFSFLPSAKEETKSVSQKYLVKLLAEGTATKTDFLTQANGYDIIHLATHGECNQISAGLSRLILSPDPSIGDDISLRIDDIREMDLRDVNLVVLSACETRACGEYQAEDINSFERAFMVARASTVISSLWVVRDKPTAYLMNRFYIHLSDGLSKAAALSKAQRDTRKEFPLPYHWAAFVLTGNPGGGTTDEARAAAVVR